MVLQWWLRLVYRGASPLLSLFEPIFGAKFGWVMWLVNRGSPIPCPQFAYSLYNFHGATMTIKGSLQPLQGSIAILRPFEPIFGAKYGWVMWLWNRESQNSRQVVNCIDFFTEKRTDDECKSYVEEAKELCTDLSLEFYPRHRPTQNLCKCEGDVFG